MLLADTLIVIGMATASLGTIQEADGTKEHTFVLRNAGTEAVTLQQGYTSCGCTTIRYDQGKTIAPGKTTRVTLRFNPRGKGGEFEETGTIAYRSEKRKAKSQKLKRVNVSLVGTCITSEETLLKQFPIRLTDHLRLSSNRFDLGIMRPGDSKERHVTVLHQDENNRLESVTLTFTVTSDMPKGVQHVVRTFKTKVKGRQHTVNVTFDVLVK